MIFALTLEYVTSTGETAYNYLPVYNSLSECVWWANWLKELLELNNATGIKASCSTM